MDKILLVGAGLVAVLATLFFSRRAEAGEPVPFTIDVELNPDNFPEDSEMTPTGSSPLGLKNNNPFNLEFRNIGWIGETGSDGRFSVFDTAENGIRAGMINIHTKMTRDGKTSVRKLINTLSPPHENPTEAFIKFVSREINVSAEQVLQFSTHITGLSKAIIAFENGSQPFDDETLARALARTGRV